MRNNKNATLDRNVSFQIMFIYLFNVRPNIIIIYIYIQKNQGQNKKVTQLEYNSAVRSVLNYCPHKIFSHSYLATARAKAPPLFQYVKNGLESHFCYFA